MKFRQHGFLNPNPRSPASGGSGGDHCARPAAHYLGDFSYGRNEAN
jgi:hypothetical protein